MAVGADHVALGDLSLDAFDGGQRVHFSGRCPYRQDFHCTLAVVEIHDAHGETLLAVCAWLTFCLFDDLSDQRAASSLVLPRSPLVPVSVLGVVLPGVIPDTEFTPGVAGVVQLVLEVERLHPSRLLAAGTLHALGNTTVCFLITESHTGDLNPASPPYQRGAPPSGPVRQRARGRSRTDEPPDYETGALAN